MLFDNVKVGDVVAVRSNNGTLSKATVSNVTATQIEVQPFGDRYMRGGGKLIGRGEWSVANAKPWEKHHDEQLASQEKKQRHERRADAVDKIHWPALTSEQLDQVVALLQSFDRLKELK